MNFTCTQCNDTGSRDKLGTYLDCNACCTATTRRDLNDFVKSLGPTHPEDVALAIHQRALAMAPKQEAPTQEQFHHYGLGAEQLQQLLDGGLKPEEISGAADVQHDRVHELVWWFARLTQGSANAKLAVRHACELAYFVATNGVNRRINLKAIRDAAFKEGVNITPEERGTLERIGFAIPRAIPIAAPAAANGAMPELPKPETMIVASDLGHRAYSADQMRAYGHACHAIGRGAAVREYIENGTFKHPVSTNGALTDEQIDGIGDKVIKVVAGERISYGQAREFARAILAAAGPDAALVKAVRNALASSITGQGSYGPNYDGNKLAGSLRAALSGAKGN